MTKNLEPIVFHPAQCRRDLAAFQKLLQSKKELAERADIQKFFKKRRQLPPSKLCLTSRIWRPSHRLFVFFQVEIHLDWL